jgi:hypothetical protein
LAWGLPKSQIEWSNGLAFESKHVRGGDLAWGLPKSQIEWSNGLTFESKHVGGVIWLGDYPNLKSSGPTVWHLNPNTLGGGDLAWGLPKSQIATLVVRPHLEIHLNGKGKIVCLIVIVSSIYIALIIMCFSSFSFWSMRYT